MKATAKKDFDIVLARKRHFIKKGDGLEFILDENSTDESGEIRLDGMFLCHNHSPFAKEHVLIDDDE